jgi:2,4-dienoyl-CoA reductase-like NADH-dependent reductase (Old Yellow Enzyme family)
MSALFQPYKLKDVSLRNRIAIPPMCQYTAEDGLINDWHRVHLAGLACGAGDRRGHGGVARGSYHAWLRGDLD